MRYRKKNQRLKKTGNPKLCLILISITILLASIISQRAYSATYGNLALAQPSKIYINPVGSVSTIANPANAANTGPWIQSVKGTLTTTSNVRGAANASRFSTAVKLSKGSIGKIAKFASLGPFGAAIAVAFTAADYLLEGRTWTKEQPTQDGYCDYIGDMNAAACEAAFMEKARAGHMSNQQYAKNLVQLPTEHLDDGVLVFKAKGEYYRGGSFKTVSKVWYPKEPGRIEIDEDDAYEALPEPARQPEHWPDFASDPDSADGLVQGIPEFDAAKGRIQEGIDAIENGQPLPDSVVETAPDLIPDVPLSPAQLPDPIGGVDPEIDPNPQQQPNEEFCKINKDMDICKDWENKATKTKWTDLTQELDDAKREFSDKIKNSGSELKQTLNLDLQKNTSCNVGWTVPVVNKKIDMCPWLTYLSLLGVVTIIGASWAAIGIMIP